MKLAISADHAGFPLKEAIKAAYPDIEWLDLGAGNVDPADDYPDYAFTLAMAVAGGYAPMGVSICGAGIGASIALNRHPAIRAALCSTTDVATLSREHNDANVLCLAGRFQTIDDVKPIFETFINTPFSGDARHVRRIRKLSLIDDGHDHDHAEGCCGGHDHNHGDHDHQGGACCSVDDDTTSPSGGCCGGGCR